MSPYVTTSLRPSHHGTQMVWYILGPIETLLGFRFLFEFLNVRSDTVFSWVLSGFTDPLLRPFFLVSNVLFFGYDVVEWIILFAMTVYFLIIWGISRLILE